MVFEKDNKNIKLYNRQNIIKKKLLSSTCTNCTCCLSLDRAIYYHLVTCCIVNDVDYHGLRIKYLEKKKGKLQCRIE
ncbi:hypothetical protein BpHYR1_054275 [Brachionus plicatilis]|uniref:Uncharacterized protein n=1 Tax=Brachionus plicatilis TaxID=10195 RepID=A0A3M7PN08_BRAPC|nr:hypothetical protein BpHYR1_054275 [Brachionus plicatilis]